MKVRIRLHGNSLSYEVTWLKSLNVFISYFPANACKSNPCKSNTLMCINNPASPTQKYSCVCPDGARFDGHMCDFVVCDTDYCKNGGICSVTQSSDFKCRYGKCSKNSNSKILISKRKIPKIP